MQRKNIIYIFLLVRKIVDFYERFLHCCKHFHKVFFKSFLYILKFTFLGRINLLAKTKYFWFPIQNSTKFYGFSFYFVSYFKIYFMWFFLGGKITVFCNVYRKMPNLFTFIKVYLWFIRLVKLLVQFWMALLVLIYCSTSFRFGLKFAEKSATNLSDKKYWLKINFK